MRIQLNKDDFQKMAQDYISEQFPNVIIRGLTFTDGVGKQHPVTKIEIDFYRMQKIEK